MSNIDSPIDHITVDDAMVDDLGGALAKRLAEQGFTPAAATVQPDVSTASTDSTGDDAGDASAPASTDPDAGTQPPVSTDAPPAGEGAAAAAAGTDRAGSAEDEGGGVDHAAPPSSTFRVRDGDTDVDLTQAQIERQYNLAKWAQGLDPRLAQAMAALEGGRAVAIDTDEFRRFQAWKQGAGQQQQQQRGPDLSDLDDDQRSYVQQLEQQNAQLQQSMQQQQMRPDPQAQQQMQAQVDANARTFAETCDSWGKQRGLSEQQVASLAQTAADMGMYATFAENERQYAPDGRLLRDSNMASVTEKALNFALVNDPDLYTRVANNQQTDERRAAIDSQANSAVSRKKALAGSMAAAPSQAQPARPIDVTKLKPEEIKSGMSAMISQLEGLPQHD